MFAAPIAMYEAYQTYEAAKSGFSLAKNLAIGVLFIGVIIAIFVLIHRFAKRNPIPTSRSDDREPA